MKPKILITVQGGVVQHITSNVDMDIVVVDYDNLEGQTENNELHIIEPDQIVNTSIYETRSFEDDDVEEENIYNQLKELNF